MTYLHDEQEATVEKDKSIASWQQWQEMYKTITHKSDTLRSFFDKPNEYKMTDIEELHNKIVQIGLTYPCEKETHNITVTYANKNQHIYENFNGFKAKAASATTDAIMVITATYNFLIRHPQTKNPHSYRIVINISSSAAEYESISKSSSVGFKFIIRVLEGPLANASIEYVDYAIAQNFMNNISQWFSSRKNASNNNFLLTLIQKNSEYIPIASKNIFTFLYAYLIAKIMIYFQLYNNVRELSLFAIFSICSGLFVREIFKKVGRSLERRIDKISKFSYIKITSGDNLLYEKTKRKNTKNILRIIFNISFQTTIAVCSTLIANYLPQMF